MPVASPRPLSAFRRFPSSVFASSVGQPALWLPFGVPGVYPSGSAMGRRGEVVTVTRATTATYVGADGLIKTAAANELRVESQGALIEPARTNRIVRSNELTNVAWTKRGAAVVTTDGTLAPDGVSLANKLAGINALGVDDVYQTATGFTASATCGTSLWLKRISTTGVLRVLNTNTGTLIASVDLGAAPDAFVRVTGTQPASAGGVGGVMFHAQSGGPLSFYVAFVQQEEGSYATSYIPTTTAAATRNADVVSVANPLTAADTTWSVEGVFTPESGRAWGISGITHRLWGFGSGSGANTAQGYVISETLVSPLVTDAAAAQLFTTKTSINALLASGTTHRISGASANGTLTVLVNGSVPAGAGLSGVGSGVISAMPATLYIGTTSAPGSEFGGNIRDFKVWRRAAR
jgi:hypothetical protein